MFIPVELSFLLAFPLLALSYPSTYSPQVPFHSSDRVRPLVVWHGMGDSHSSKGMLNFASVIKDIYPGIFVHSIYVEEDLDADQRASFYGKVDEQVARVAEQLSNITELRDGFDAIGFSQGGQFLRAFVERYNNPPINNLLTFGSQHMGIADLPICKPGDFTCQLARRAAKAGVYNSWAQNNLVQAQYFRDPAQLPSYLSSNKFLTSINNELLDTVNTTYATHLASLHNLVLILFSKDKTVVPKETAWFGSFAPLGNSASLSLYAEYTPDTPTIIPMRLQPLYLTDVIGLRTLDERGGVVLETCEGEHMEITQSCWEPLVKRYLGGKL